MSDGANHNTEIHGGAFRSGKVLLDCRICAERTEAQPCPRCGHVFCERHGAPEPPRGRCSCCEAAFDEAHRAYSAMPISPWLIVTLILAIPSGLGALVWGGTAAGVPTKSLVLFALALGCAAALTPLLIGPLRRRRLRRIFESERPSQRKMAARPYLAPVTLPPVQELLAALGLCLVCPLGPAAVFLAATWRQLTLKNLGAGDRALMTLVQCVAAVLAVGHVLLIRGLWPRL